MSHPNLVQTARILWVYAHPSEGGRVVPHLQPTLALGVGKVAAASTLAFELSRSRPSAVIALGLCGAFPLRHRASGSAEPALPVGGVCIVTQEVLADDGVATTDGFVDIAAMGLGAVGPWRADPRLVAMLRTRLPEAALVAGATVSTVTGTDTTSAAIALRTLAHVETMEGAAIAAACALAEVPCAQVRVISNETGDRTRGGWNLPGALERLEDVARTLSANLDSPRS